MSTAEGTMDIIEETRGNVTIVKFRGRLDAISSPAAEKHVGELINNGSNKLIFDFAGVDYLSSAGMRMLLSTTKKLKGLSGKLVLCTVNPSVMDVLTMSGFDHVLDIAQSQNEALPRF